jgi:hypothetical protein
MKKISVRQKQERRRLQRTTIELIEILRINDWPLGAKDRPLTFLGLRWVELTKEEVQLLPTR